MEHGLPQRTGSVRFVSVAVDEGGAGHRLLRLPRAWGGPGAAADGEPLSEGGWLPAWRRVVRSRSARVSHQALHGSAMHKSRGKG